MDIVSYALSHKYTDDSIAGGGISAGKNCTVDSITEITDGHRMTFKWTLDNGTVKTGTMDVMDGDDAQVDTLPEASAAHAGELYQYVGATTADLTNGYFYQCVEDGGTYSWEEKRVQTGGSGETDELTNEQVNALIALL